MKFKKPLLALLILTLISGASYSMGGFLQTGAHNSITMEKSWLNTSRAINADELKGRIILLDFWTYCCINCIQIMPELKALEKKFGNKLTVIGVHSAKFDNEKDSENIRSAILRYGIEHPVVNDSAFRIWKQFNVKAWPTLILINPEGKIEKLYSGEGHFKEIERDVQNLITTYGPSLNKAKLPLQLEKEKAPKTILKFPSKLEYTENFQGEPALFISDSGNNRILVVRPNGKIFLEIGSGKNGKRNGDFAEAEFNSPHGILYDNNSLYIADTGNHLLRKADFISKQVTTIAGTGKRGQPLTMHNINATTTPLASPWDLVFYPDKSTITIAMAGTHQLWQYHIKNNAIDVLAGNGEESIKDGSYPTNTLSQPSGLSVVNDKLYFVDAETSSLRVLQNNQVKTLIGEGLFDFGYVEGKKLTGLMQHPLGLFADDTNVYIADTYNHSIRRYDIPSKTLKNYAGEGIRGNFPDVLLNSRFNEPNDVLKVENKIFVADTNNHAIRIIDIENSDVNTIDILPADPELGQFTEYSEDLPNLRRMPQVKVLAGEGNKIFLSFPEGWKLNAAAPSWVSLFQINGSQLLNVKNFYREDLEKGIVLLPDLPDKKDFKLQGTIYYCEDKPDSICLIQSFDMLVSSSTSFRIVEIKIPIKPEK